MRKILLMVLLFAGISSYAQLKSKSIAIQNLKKFKTTDKFKPNEETGYTGLSDLKLRIKFSQLLNLSADDFMKTASTKPTEKSFQKDIETGLKRFDSYYLNTDTEDREQICSYFEELMNCVGLQSSGGQLNKWLYGFDPSQKN